MTRIDFYLLPDDDADQRLAMVCRLAEEAVQQCKRVFIHTECDALANELDATLWHYRDDSFLPHRTLNDAAGKNTKADANSTVMVTEPVAIGCAASQPDPARSVLINLACDVPPFFSRFERTLEIINQQQDIRDSGRRRYSFYQQRGYPLTHYKMS